MRKLFVVLVVGALFIVAVLVSRGASAAGPSVGATDATVAPGEAGTSQLFTHGMSAPGLGAWTIDVAYDPDVITVTGCLAVSQTSVCNPNYADGVVRSSGANAEGLDGDPILTEIRFRCADSTGMTTLDVMPRDVSDATLGGPRLLDVDDFDGTVSCEEGAVSTPTTASAATPTGAVTPAPAAPNAGTGQGTPEAPWRVFATLAMLVSAALVFGAGLRVFTRRVE